MPKSDQGVTIKKRYSVIPRVLIFITRGDEILLIKGAQHKHLWANKYNGIGGHLERGEDIHTCALRELKEESGLQTELWLCGVITIDAEDETGVMVFILRGEYQGGDLISSSEGAIEWIKVDQVDKFPLVEDLYILLPRVLNMKSGDSPFMALYTYDNDDQLVIRFGCG